MLAQLPDDELNQRFPSEAVEMLQTLRQALYGLGLQSLK
jgi:hypothetical protein